MSCIIMTKCSTTTTTTATTLRKKAFENVYLVTEHYCISIKKASLSQFPPKSSKVKAFFVLSR